MGGGQRGLRASCGADWLRAPAGALPTRHAEIPKAPHSRTEQISTLRSLSAAAPPNETPGPWVLRHGPADPSAHPPPVPTRPAPTARPTTDQVYLANNRLVTLPESYAGLPMVDLFLSENDFTTVPKAVLGMSQVWTGWVVTRFVGFLGFLGFYPRPCWA